MQEKLVITGMGAVTPVGIGVGNFWNNLVSGASGISRLTRFDVSDLPVQFGAEVKDFTPESVIPKKLIREMDLFMQYAYVAAEEALADSELVIDPQRTGIVMSTALGGTGTIAAAQEQMNASANKNVSPRFVPKVLGNITAAQISIAHDIRGPSLTVSTACASGGDAILMASMLLQAGMCDAVLVVGGEAALCPILIRSLANAHALSRRNDAPDRASRPFDTDRDGFVMGEGGGALLLETESHALARGASIRAELAGCANNTDAHHVTAPRPDGSGAAACMRAAITMAGIEPDRIGYINAHGTSTKVGDLAETLAIKNVFGSAVDGLSISSTKGATGHMMAAGGILEVITCIMALQEQILPPTLNLEHPDPECDLDFVPLVAREKALTYAMSNAFGFGGQNSSILLKKYES